MSDLDATIIFEEEQTIEYVPRTSTPVREPRFTMSATQVHAPLAISNPEYFNSQSQCAVKKEMNNRPILQRPPPSHGSARHREHNQIPRPCIGAYDLARAILPPPPPEPIPAMRIESALPTLTDTELVSISTAIQNLQKQRQGAEWHEEIHERLFRDVGYCYLSELAIMADAFDRLSCIACIENADNQQGHRHFMDRVGMMQDWGPVALRNFKQAGEALVGETIELRIRAIRGYGELIAPYINYEERQRRCLQNAGFCAWLLAEIARGIDEDKLH